MDTSTIRRYYIKDKAMQTTNRFLDDLAKLAIGLLGVGKGIRDELKQRVFSQAEGYAEKMDLVTRQEFEVFRDIAQQARLQSEKLDERMTKLEKSLKKRDKEFYTLSE